MSPIRLFGGRPTTREEQQLAMRIAAIFAIPMALIMVIPLIAGFLFYRHVTNDRLKDNKELIATVSRERIERSRAINGFVFDQCVNAEVRDVVTVEQYRADIRLAKAYFPKGQILDNWIQTRLDGIAALEPVGEPDCQPPPAVK